MDLNFVDINCKELGGGSISFENFNENFCWKSFSELSEEYKKHVKDIYEIISFLDEDKDAAISIIASKLRNSKIFNKLFTQLEEEGFKEDYGETDKNIKNIDQLIACIILYCIVFLKRNNSINYNPPLQDIYDYIEAVLSFDGLLDVRNMAIVDNNDIENIEETKKAIISAYYKILQDSFWISILKLREKILVSNLDLNLSFKDLKFSGEEFGLIFPMKMEEVVEDESVI